MQNANNDERDNGMSEGEKRREEDEVKDNNGDPARLSTP